MRHLWKKGLALALIVCVSVSGTGCSGNKDKKDKPAATEDVSSESRGRNAVLTGILSSMRDRPILKYGGIKRRISHRILLPCERI